MPMKKSTCLITVGKLLGLIPFPRLLSIVTLAVSVQVSLRLGAVFVLRRRQEYMPTGPYPGRRCVAQVVMLATTCKSGPGG